MALKITQSTNLDIN